MSEIKCSAVSVCLYATKLGIVIDELREENRALRHKLEVAREALRDVEARVYWVSARVGLTPTEKAVHSEARQALTKIDAAEPEVKS